MGAVIEFPDLRRRPSLSAYPRRGQRQRRRERSAAAIAVGLVLAAACFFLFSATLEASGAAASIRARAIDGDTIENVTTGERIRVSNIDTPETGERAQCAAERAAGERAKDAARALVSAGAVTIEASGRIDKYGRTIALVRVDGRDLGAIMMERGLARPWRGRREPWCGADGALLPAI